MENQNPLEELETCTHDLLLDLDSQAMRRVDWAVVDNVGSRAD